MKNLDYTLAVIAQIALIFINTGIVCYLANKIWNMDYGFIKSIYLRVRFKNNIGIEYISNNFIYVIALIMAWSRLLAVGILEEQMISGKLGEKTSDRFASGFLLGVSLFLLVVERFAIQDRIGFRHMIRKFVRHPHHK